MGWEKRGKGGKRLVYYRKKRVNGRVVSLYVGSGEVGERAEREDRDRSEAIEAIRRTALAPALMTEVLPVAPPEVLPVAPAQVEEAARVTKMEDEARWAEYFRPREPPRRCRS